MLTAYMNFKEKSMSLMDTLYMKKETMQKANNQPAWLVCQFFGKKTVKKAQNKQKTLFYKNQFCAKMKAIKKFFINGATDG